MTVSEPEVEAERSWRPSLVWLAPLAALAISLFIAWSSWSSRGPVVEVVFASAGGIEAGKTPLKHRDVEVGRVEDVGFTEDLGGVLASIRLDPDIAPYIDDTARFWVVRPQVSARGITGLETVLSGSYIEVAWDAEIGEPQERFTALEEAPLTDPGEKGIRLRLIANDGGAMSVGAPILYKRIEVGRVEDKALSGDGERVEFDVFVNAPYDKLITSATRFWTVSGLAVELGAEGARLQVDSLASLLRGGVAFDTVAIDAAPVDPDQPFILYASESEARRSIFTENPREQIRLTVEFESSVRGLRVGAPVEYRGLRVGEVTNVAARVETLDGETDISLVVTLVIQPARLGLPVESREETIAFLKRAVSRGLRAKLVSASLLTGALYVDLVEDPAAPVAIFDDLAEPYPRLPSVPSDFDDFTASAEGVLNRINALPVEELLYSANELLRNANALLAAEETTAIPGQVAGILEGVRVLVDGPELKGAVEDVAAAAAAARGLAEALEGSGAVEALEVALRDASEAAQAVAAFAVPATALATTYAGVGEDIRELPLDELVGNASALLASADAVLGNDDAAALPASLNGSLGEVRLLLASLREADAATELASTLAAARQGATAFEASLKDLPPLLRRLDAIGADVEELPLDRLIAAATSLVENADAVISAEGTERIPGALAEALEAARALLADLDEAEAADNLAGALAATREAAESVNAAVAGTPELVARLSNVARDIDQLPLDALVASARSILEDVEAITADEGVQAAPRELAETLAALRALIVGLEEAGAAQNLAEALAAARDAAASIDAAAAEAPALVRRLSTIAADVEGLPLDALVATANGILADVDALTSDEGFQRIPRELAATLETTRGLLGELREADAAARLAEALGEASAAARSIGAAAQTAPALVARLNALADKASALPLEQVLASTDGLLNDARLLAASPDVARVAPSLNAALDQVRSLVVELRQGGAAQNANAALASVDGAARSFQALSAQLQGLVPQLAQVAAQADSVLASLDVGSELNYEAVTALREVRDAARAITALAATVERKPNSLILGK